MTSVLKLDILHDMVAHLIHEGRATYSPATGSIIMMDWDDESDILPIRVVLQTVNRDGEVETAQALITGRKDREWLVVQVQNLWNQFFQLHHVFEMKDGI